MQILASALPGFRDLRAPLAAGYLWMLLLWIYLQPDLSIRPVNDIAGSIYDLGKSAGPIWIGLAVSVAAYLIGSVSQIMSPALGSSIKKTWDRFEKLTNRIRSKKCFGWVPLMPVSKPTSPLYRYWEDAVAGVRHHNRDNPDIADNAASYVEFLADEASPKIERDVSLPATLLLAKETLLFTEVDRLNAERSFRLAIVPPLTGLTVFASINVSAWWLLILIPVVVLLLQSHVKLLEYRYLMYGAIERGIIASDSVDMFRELGKIEPRNVNEDRD